jgi:hypothetical protein
VDGDVVTDADLRSGNGGSATERASIAGNARAADGPAQVRRHRIRVTLLVVGALVLVVIGVVVGSYLLRSHPGARSLGSATRQFEASTTTSPTARHFVLPPAGVYAVSGNGTERISVPPNTENDSALMPVSVSYLAGGCWRWRIDYNTAGWHEYDFCPKGNQLLLEAQRNFQSWDFGVTTVTNLAQFTCDPPSPIVVESPRSGETFVHRCAGTNTAVPGPSSAAGPVTIVGVETEQVGGTPVRAIHMTRRQAITGSQTGELDESWWFATTSGMPLRSVRNYRLATNSPIGQIIYTESGSWHLDSLTPRT